MISFNFKHRIHDPGDAKVHAMVTKARATSKLQKIVIGRGTFLVTDGNEIWLQLLGIESEHILVHTSANGHVWYEEMA